MPNPLIRVPYFPRVEEFVGVWAMEPTAFTTASELIRRTDLLAHMQAGPPPVRASMEKTVTGTGKTIAVVRVLGTLMKQQTSMSEGSSTIQIRRELRQAAADPDVSAILLAIDSPGGTVAGTDDLAADVRAARKSKPVWAFIDDLGASAAYWIASQAEKVFANSDTALVGSIGTLMVVYDLSAAAEKEGIKTFVFQTGSLKGTGVPGSVITEEQATYFQSLVNSAQESFDVAVRKGRGLSEKQLVGVRSGAVFSAGEALDRKLIDGIRSFDQTMNELSRSAGSKARTASLPGGKPLEAKMGFHEWLTAKGFDPNTLNDTMRAALETAFNAERTGPAPARNTQADIEADRRAWAAEEQRRDAIRAVCEKHGNPSMEVNGERVSIASLAIGSGWTLDKTTLEAMRYGRPNVPNIVTGAVHPNATKPIVLEAALSMSLGQSSLEKAYKPEILEAAHKSYRGGIGLQQLLMTAAVDNGYAHSPGEKIRMGNLREVLSYAFPQRHASGGFSTVSLSGILGNVANKEILEGYQEEDQTIFEVVQIKSVNNFHQVTSYRMLDDMEYEELGPGGEIKHGKVDQESYTRQAKTYAKMFALTMQNVVNDDMQAFADIRTRIGKGSMKKLNKIGWTAWIANAATIWTAARTNYISGATTNLGTDGVGLGLGLKAFRQMRSPAADGSKRVGGGSTVGGTPQILLVPPELEGNADKLYMGEKLNVGNGPGEENIYRNKYRPVCSSFLSDTTFHASASTTAWWLLRNPKDKAAIVISFLDGQQTPTVEESDADFNTLGIQFRGWHCFGADPAEYLCGLMSKGAA